MMLTLEKAIKHFDDFIGSQIRFNAIIANLLDESGVIARREFADRLRRTAERIPEGEGRHFLSGLADGIDEKTAPELIVIEGGKRDTESC